MNSQHLRHCNTREHRSRSDRNTSNGGEDSIRRDGCDTETAPDPLENLVRYIVGVFTDVSRSNQRAHQDEKRHHPKNVTGNRIATRLGQQISRDLKVAAHEVHADKRCQA